MLRQLQKQNKKGNSYIPGGCKTITFVSDDILMRLYVSIVSILLPWAKLKYLYFIKIIESNTIYSLFYFKLNFLKMYILGVAKRNLHCIY